MKSKIQYLLAFIIIQIVLPQISLSQDSLEYDFSYKVDLVYPPLSITKKGLINVVQPPNYQTIII